MSACLQPGCRFAHVSESSVQQGKCPRAQVLSQIPVAFHLHSPPLGLSVVFNMPLVAAEALSGHVLIREAEGLQVLETREMEYH